MTGFFNPPHIEPTRWHDQLHETIQALQPRLTEIALAIHRRPELAMRESFAANVLAGFLRENGFGVSTNVAGLPTAFDARRGTASPVIAVLCEYDALPDIGHACGHNLIAASGAGAAIAAATVLGHDAPGSIRCIGTPGEEGAGGKIIQLEAGLFDDVDAALMWHPSDRTIPWRHATAAVHLDIEFRGIAAHAAGNPQDGRSALAAVIQLFTGIDSLRQFIPETARIHGIITDGGQAQNIVPEHAAAALMVRALTQDAVGKLLDRVKTCASAAASATGTTVEFTEGRIYAERKNNHTIATRAAGHLHRLGVPSEIPVLRGGTGSSDIGNVSLRLPTIHPYVAIMPAGTPSHSRAMASAAATPHALDRMTAVAESLAATAIDLFTNPQLMQDAKSEFKHGGPDLPD